jgi:hypothetical protein
MATKLHCLLFGMMMVLLSTGCETRIVFEPRGSASMISPDLPIAGVERIEVRRSMVDRQPDLVITDRERIASIVTLLHLERPRVWPEEVPAPISGRALVVYPFGSIDGRGIVVGVDTGRIWLTRDSSVVAAPREIMKLFDVAPLITDPVTQPASVNIPK